ncbi:TetR/AcrR family transcriptional regulator [Mycolicibacterium obuense]|uniref:Bacterial regulatory protein, tetR family n=1 Tax=Mycolicibacterium obuense TaxID=1807 RepID=A0A0J6Y532_9MYCO|nr:TetR/AcrR family transcriptional regulator [Mycolicibacterium obuense]KKE99623.1 TetR family transcriptional regulator [Mycolicibacterium obuense]KMO68191.1 Bacterial regulatory protein, tetR family [Mycolicibacterium obuense]TDL09852.1 TetR/AcrR family transcriptional regulator [Mycolicibacterium obuense]
MTTELGRPRDRRIDDAVLAATAEMIGEVPYAELSVGAIARRAGTSKPAIYRRWPSKAHLVHEAVFPIGEATQIPATGSLAHDIREMVRRVAALLTTPAARAAIPGLIAEMAADPTLHAALLTRFGDVITRGLGDFLRDAVQRGDVRAGIDATELAEAVAGITLLSLVTRPDAPDDGWLDRTATLITRGIAT